MEPVTAHQNDDLRLLVLEAVALVDAVEAAIERRPRDPEHPRMQALAEQANRMADDLTDFVSGRCRRSSVSLS